MEGHEDAEITAEGLAAKKKRGEDIVLLDVREQWERDICTISNDIQIPMRDVRTRFTELPKDKEIIVYCHTGNRSFWITNFLLSQGFRAKNLEGGIDEWAEKIEKEMKRY
ncbi:MAG: sulfurtransferase [Candidatus Aenigmarchaeota archaeon]|nr:sulfurtransferase [Candidatus Aenigmarchaeota archaeon]